MVLFFFLADFFGFKNTTQVSYKSLLEMQRTAPKDESMIDERARALTNLRLSHFKGLGASPKPAAQTISLQK